MAHVVVLVLGDLGRSPRMQYHATSLCEMGDVARVTLVGYKGESILPQLAASQKVHVEYVQQPSFVAGFKHIRLLFALAKGLGLLYSLCLILATLPDFQLILIQNPPALPALIAALLVSIVRRFKILLDWHNLGFSMYSHSIGAKHPLTRFSKVLEHRLGRWAHYHICVSNEMSKWLLQHFGIRAEVFHDKPAVLFQSAALDDHRRHALLSKLAFCERAFLPKATPTASATREQTIQTTVGEEGGIRRRQEDGRVALLVSSTSWTSDEDFDLLFQALVNVESILAKYPSIEADNPFNRLLVVITGKGELKAAFEERVRQAAVLGQLHRKVFVQTAWLEVADYPVLLQCADLGISLHASTSGLDLPMKVVDMFGAGLPVCALRFATISELVLPQHNGLVFDSSDELAGQILRLIFNTAVEKEKDAAQRLPRRTGSKELRAMRENLQEMENWTRHWDRVMLPMVTQAITP